METTLKKVVFAGSHAGSTALSVIEEIKSQKLGLDIYWFGNKYATEKMDHTSFEYNNFPKLGVKFIDINSGRIQNNPKMRSIKAPVKIPFGFFKVFNELLKIKPDLILSFGGAVGAMASFCGYAFRIPVIIHEQTSVAGRANIFSSKFASIVAISRDSSRKFFKKAKKVVLTGNPINKAHQEVRVSPRQSLKTIFITGGSRGSQTINESINEILPYLLEKYKVVHQVGAANIGNYKEKKDNYRVFGQVDPKEFGRIISEADLVISRAGANTVSEILLHKKPSILIPIPWSYLNEQGENAKYLESFGGSLTLQEDNLTKENLIKNIEYIDKNYTKLTKKLQKTNDIDIEAASNIVNLINKYLK